MKKNIIFGLSLLALIACNKEDDQAIQNAAGEQNVNSMQELNVADDFNWSASFQSKLEVTFTNPHNLSVEEELIYILDNNDNTLAKTRVKNGLASFDVYFPSNGQYSLYLPFTGHQQTLSKQAKQNFDLSQKMTGKRGTQFNKTNSSSCTVCETPMTNNLAELPVLPIGRQTIISQNSVPGWQTTATDGKIEIWSTGFGGVTAQEGNQFFEINANRPGALYQELCLEPGSTISWSVWHRGRAGVDVAQVKIGGSLATATVEATMTSGTSAWNNYTGTYAIPANQTTTLFIFEAVSAAGGGSVGNFLDNFRISCDQDGDGVADINDDYPTDPSRAYRSFFPSAGKQIVAFEDLWPATGDYDFNDLVLSNQVEISHNANNELVDAKFAVSIDAIGAGLANGIGLMLRNESKAVLANGSITSVSGNVSLDPANNSGLIVSNDVFASISSYYQNNGSGPSRTPDTLKFTVNFGANAGSELLPELYLFRTNDRALEVHRSGFSPSAAFDAVRANTIDDNGDFKTANGLPWGIEIITETSYDHALEKIDMVQAYPQFASWAASGGSQNTSWFLNPDAEKVFDTNP
jgi:LruC domain-containing protein